MNTTEMRLLKRQIDESFAHLKDALKRRHDLINRQIELAVRDEYTALPSRQASEFSEIMDEAKALEARARKFTGWLEKNKWYAVTGPYNRNRTDPIEVTYPSSITWVRAKVQEETERRKIEVQETYNTALHTIEADRLRLNREVLEDNVENTADVLAKIPQAAELLPAPSYIELPV